MLIHDKFYCEGFYNDDKFYDVAKQLSKRQGVEFALYCVKDVFHLIEEEHKEYVKHCFDLVEKWLENENSVTSDELYRAIRISHNVDIANHVARQAAWAVARIVELTAISANANANANAAWIAALAVDAASRASNKLNEYLIIANSYLTKTNINCLNYEIEGKILYLIDELEENIIIHKDKYYVNMNGIELCPEYGFDSQDKLLNELLNNKCLFWEFTRNWLDRLYKNQQA